MIRGDKLMQELKQTGMEQMQEDVRGPDIDADVGGISVQADALQEELDDVADSFSVDGFKCAKCELTHMHSTNKHRASDSFDMGEDEAASMEYANFCHCGVNELARHGSDYGVDEGSAESTASMAPIPDETARQLDQQFGSL